MLTFGGHKGSALSTMIELIAGPLIGDLTSLESLRHDDGAAPRPTTANWCWPWIRTASLGTARRNTARAGAFLDAFDGTGARLPSQRRYQAPAQPAEGVRIRAAASRTCSRCSTDLGHAASRTAGGGRPTPWSARQQPAPNTGPAE